MKKRKLTLALALLLVCVTLITSVVVLFTLSAAAVDAAEASLLTETITYNASGKESGRTTVSTEEGSYAELVAKLATLSPTVSTRYTLSLLSDVTTDKSVVISANELAEVRVELGGRKLTYTGSGAAFTLSGNGATLRISGGFDDLGEMGTVAVTNGDGALAALSENSASLIDVKYIDATYSGYTLIDAKAGTATLRESAVSFIGNGSASVIKAKDAVANLKYVDVVATDSASVLDLSAAKGYIEGGTVFAGSIVKTDTTKCDALIVSVDTEVVVAFAYGSADTTVYVLGGRIGVSSALTSGDSSSANLVFYYGDGTMTVSGDNPTVYGIQSGCSFALDEETYVMSSSSTNVAMATTAVLGEAPVVSGHGSYIKGMGGLDRVVSAAQATTAVGINTLLKDAPVESAKNFSANENVSVIIDLNGHNLNFLVTSTKQNQYVGNMHVTFDGEGADGSVGTMLSNSQSMMFFYIRQNSTTGVINEHSVTRIENVNFEVANLGSAGGNAFININSGDSFIKNVKMTYTGAALEEGHQTYAYLMSFDHSAGPLVNGHLENVEFVNTSSAGVNVYPFNCTASARVYARNIKVSGAYTVSSVATDAKLALIDSAVSVSDVVFAGTGNAYVYDSALSVTSGAVSNTALVHFVDTERCKTTVDACGNVMSGNYVTNEGFAMVPTADYVYSLTSGVNAPKPPTFPVIFADGMVFQRGKTINVFGFCEDLTAEFRATLGDRVGTGKVDENGRFQIELEPINEPTWDLTLTVEQTNSVIESKVSFTDVAVGEVWVVSGQSNAQLATGYLEDVEEVATLADTFNNIRAYHAPANYNLLPQKYGSATWKKVDSKLIKSTSGISAVAYTAVAKLAAELGPDTPIALINVARSASKIKTWLDYESLVDISPSEAKKYMDCVEAGKLPDKPHTKIGTILYNQLIAPLTGFETAGVIWYQGCGDVAGESLGVEGSSYTKYFTALEALFRRTFGDDDDLPVYVVELAPYTQDSESGANKLASFKAEQYDFCKSLHNTYLVPIMTDGGVWSFTLFDQGYIHPARKSTIGIRTADMILANEYSIGNDGVYQYPSPTSAVTVGNSVVVSFDTDIKLLFGDKPVGFEIFDGSSWRKAEGSVEGNKITLTASGVTAPTAVRYGFSKVTAELKDGTMIEFLSTGAKIDKTAETITFTYGGVTYVVDSANDYIRSIDFGNITNASGIPMPVFSIVCE